MKSVEVKYFASLREAAGRTSETLSSDCATYADLYRQLAMKHNFKLPVTVIQLAVDDEYAELGSTIKDGARVVFIPPVSGG